MKKIINTLLLVAVFATGCKKEFIDLRPEAAITTGNFYKTEDQFQQALIGTYAMLRVTNAGFDSWVMSEMRSDNTHYDMNPTDRGPQFLDREDIANFIDNSSNVVIASKYNLCFNGIQRANTILSRIESAEVSAAAKDNIIGQTKFLRALFYFDLVRYFGGVPLHITEVTGPESAFLPRATTEEVYKQIVEDVQDAIAKLSVPVFPQTGRANKGSAEMLLAYVYMTQKKYAEAETELKKITQMGYTLLPDYASVYALNNKNSKESILEAQFQQGTTGLNSNFVYYFIPIGQTKLITGIEYNNRSFGGWNIPTQAMINSYESGDTRLDASIAIAEGTGTTGNFTIESVKSPLGYAPPAGKSGKPFIKKYLHPHTQAANTDDNFPIYRYADALLLLAEALNEQGKSGDALPFLNQVRTRAGLPSSTETDQAALRSIIAHERKIELAFENKRWFDLLRTGKAIEVMTADGQYMKSIHPYLLPSSYNVTENRLIYAIPLRETLIGNLTQNLGY